MAMNRMFHPHTRSLTFEIDEVDVFADVRERFGKKQNTARTTAEITFQKRPDLSRFCSLKPGAFCLHLAAPLARALRLCPGFR